MHSDTDIRTTEVDLEVLVCVTCGTVFGIAKRMCDALRNSGDKFYCPNGHAQVFRYGDIDRLKQQKAELEKRLKNALDGQEFYKAEAETRARELKTARSALTRLKNRTAEGLCPCCGKKFVVLEKHMARVHPDYVAKEEAEETHES